MFRAVLALIVATAAAVAASPALEARQAPPTCALTVCSFKGNLTLPGGLTVPDVTLSPDAACVGCADTTCLPLNTTRLDVPALGTLLGDISVCGLCLASIPSFCLIPCQSLDLPDHHCLRVFQDSMVLEQ